MHICVINEREVVPYVGKSPLPAPPDLDPDDAYSTARKFNFKRLPQERTRLIGTERKFNFPPHAERTQSASGPSNRLSSLRTAGLIHDKAEGQRDMTLWWFSRLLGQLL
jgi:hypothetical protein